MQRLPVRIAVDPRDGQPALRAGTTVTVFIDTEREPELAKFFTARSRRSGARIDARRHNGLGRALVLLSVILATTLYATTLTIANVALPQTRAICRRASIRSPGC